MAATILVVDDEIRMRKLVKDFLEKDGFNIIEAGDGEDAINIFRNSFNKIDLILLDVMMPKLDGWSVLKLIREENKSVPVIMLTAKSEEQDELQGFELGVDEYITKPFSPKVMVARVEACLRRCIGNLSDLIEVPGIKIDKVGRKVEVDGKQVELSLREYELLVYLIEHQNEALSRENILQDVWNYEFFGDTRTIDSHIKQIRHKIGKHGKYIETVRGVGYKFEIK